MHYRRKISSRISVKIRSTSNGGWVMIKHQYYNYRSSHSSGRVNRLHNCCFSVSFPLSVCFRSVTLHEGSFHNVSILKYAEQTWSYAMETAERKKNAGTEKEELTYLNVYDTYIFLGCILTFWRLVINYRNLKSSTKY